MLTIMCPNCRHRFRTQGCCGGEQVDTTNTTASSGPAVLFDASATTNKAIGGKQQVTVSTKYDIQSGGCLIQSTQAELLLEVPNVKTKSTLTGGCGFLVQQPTPMEPCNSSLFINEEKLMSNYELAREIHRQSNTSSPSPPPSGCEKLPGTRNDCANNNHTVNSLTNDHQQSSHCCCCTCRCCHAYCRNSTKQCCSHSEGQIVNVGCRRSLCQVAANDSNIENSRSSADVRIEVNATLHLPSTSTASSCTLSITASSSTPPRTSTPKPESALTSINARINNSFHGGGLISQLDSNGYHVEDMPSSNVPVFSCPWIYQSSYMLDKDLAKLQEARRTLQGCSWYYEGLSWQQSENLLKDAPVGRWLIRDSSDSRYSFAISVQTPRGPTSVRVFFFLGKFRLDCEPRLALAMPLFDCPIKMLEYYCEYSKHMDEQRREVWVDYSGQVYSPIYLAEPLVKEVRSLSHLARLVVNKYGLRLEKEKSKLPPLIKEYLNEYPYSL